MQVTLQILPLISIALSFGFKLAKNMLPTLGLSLHLINYATMIINNTIVIMRDA